MCSNLPIIQGTDGEQVRTQPHQEILKNFDIIIVNYKSNEYLAKCVRSLALGLGPGMEARLFVQDNESDGTLIIDDASFNEVTVTRNEKNIGFAAAVNQGIRASRSPYVILLNPDSRISGTFFEPVLQFMEDNSKVGILGPRILEPDGRIQGSARAFPNMLTGLFGRTSLLTKLFPNNPITRKNIVSIESDGISPLEVDWVSGACMVVRRKAIEEVGLLDERFFMYWEDADWCRRMWERGWKVVYFPGVHVIHDTGKSSAQRPLRSALEFHKSSYLLFAKYAKGPVRLLLPCVFSGLALRIVFVVCVYMFRRSIEKIRNADNERMEKGV